MIPCSLLLAFLELQKQARVTVDAIFSAVIPDGDVQIAPVRLPLLPSSVKMGPYKSGRLSLKRPQLQACTQTLTALYRCTELQAAKCCTEPEGQGKHSLCKY